MADTPNEQAGRRLQGCQMVFGGAVDRRDGERVVEGDKTPVVRRGQGEQVRIRDLTWTVQARPVHDSGVQEADIAGPELVRAAVARPPQEVDGL